MSSQSSNVVIPSLCRGYILSSKIVSYSPRDIILYALSVGLSNSNALDELDLKFTYEFSPEFSVLPSFPVVLTSFDDMFEGLNNCSGIPNFNPMMLLHGEQKIVFCQSTNTTTTNRSATTTTTIDEEERREGRTGGDVSVHFPVESKVSVVSRIIDVVDKIKGALVIIETEGRQQQEDNGEQIIAGEGGDEKNNLMFKIYISLFIRGIGGFSNDKKNELIVEDIFDRNVEKPKRKPDVIVDRSTFPSQALLYRLNGDKNPLHADPAMAALGGFDKPILHGLCSYGIAVHSLVRHICGNEPSAVLSASSRFVAPVVPGDDLSVRFWIIRENTNNNSSSSKSPNEETVVFDVMNVRSGKLCVDNGVARVRKSTTTGIATLQSKM
eukprot:GHVS01069082.1.p1 GENE.GHVS01069082.1~~GHVS01069082.1.p1  ORF type:complete len:382 (-),score=78.52 GHVS01069082.1:33-1178(-)